MRIGLVVRVHQQVSAEFAHLQAHAFARDTCFAGAGQGDTLRIELMFRLKHTCGQRVRRITVQDGYGSLADDRTIIQILTQLWMKFSELL